MVSYRSGRGGATGLAPPTDLAESSSEEDAAGVGVSASSASDLNDSWDPKIIAAGGRTRSSGNASAEGSSHRRKTFGGAARTSQESPTSQQRLITSTSGGDRPSAAQTAAAAAALGAANGGPAAPGAQVGVEVSPTKDRSQSRMRGGRSVDVMEEVEPQPLASPLMACFGDTSAVFREKLNCEYFEERQPSPRKSIGRVYANSESKDNADTDPPRIEKKPSKIDEEKYTGVRAVIEESESLADQPSPHSVRKQRAFFSQLDNHNGDEDDGVVTVDHDEEPRQRASSGGEDDPEGDFNDRAPPLGGSSDNVSPAAAKETAEEGGIMTDILQGMSEICNFDGPSKDKAKGGGAAAATASGDQAGAGAEPKDEDLNLDICTYLQNVCGSPSSVDDAPPPPPPLPPPLPIEATRAGAAAAAQQDGAELNTSVNGRAAQLDLSNASGLSRSRTDQNENTAIEVEYVDPDYYTDDEEGNNARSSSKKKRRGMGIGKGLSKVFGKSGKSKKKQAASASSDIDDDIDRRIAAGAVAAGAVGAGAIAVGAMQEVPSEEGNLNDRGNSTADNTDLVPIDEKNAHLQRLADDANDDYMYRNGSPPSSPQRGAHTMAVDDSSVPEDDYADWRPSEKRRFLQLLSQGMSPRESARTIKNTRRGIVEPVGPEDGGIDADADAFNDADSKGIEEVLDEHDADDEHAMVAAAVIAAAAGGAGAMALTSGGKDASMTAENEEEQSDILNDLNETGVSYYDGDRRDDPRDFADAPVDISGVSASSSQNVPSQEVRSNKKKGILPAALKTKGFSSLDSSINDGRGQEKKSTAKGFSILSPKRTKDGFSTLDSDDDEYEEEYGGNRAIASPRPPMGSTKNRPFSSGASVSSAMMTLRSPKQGFQKMDSEEDMGDYDKSSIASRDDEEQSQKKDRDDDTIFDFNEAGAVAAAGATGAATATMRAPPGSPEEGVESDVEADLQAPISSDMSVVSGITASTSYTNGMSVSTSMTGATSKSTRRRHRGAAKKRAKEAEDAGSTNGVGWLDSIRAAAASNNRVWDPQRGWVDYEDPGTSEVDPTDSDAVSVSRIGALSLAGKVGKSRGVDDDADDQSQASTSSAPIPFPKDWEAQRNQMIEETYAHGDTGLPAIEEDAASSSLPPSSNVVVQAAAAGSMVPLTVAPQNGTSSDDTTVSSALTNQSGLRSVDERTGAPKGWIDSMRAASAKVNASDPNKRWDPQNGWTGLPSVEPTEEPEQEEVEGKTLAIDGAAAAATGAAAIVASSRGSSNQDEVVGKETNSANTRASGGDLAQDPPSSQDRTTGHRSAVSSLPTADSSKKSGSMLPPKIPAKDRQDHADKASPPEVQVVKLRMDEKDKDLFVSRDDSDHFIDDSNFAPDFSPLGTPSSTPSRPNEKRGIELDAEGIGLVADNGKPQGSGSAPSEHRSNDRSVLEEEGLDEVTVPSVSSRAKQWMELMESKSKKKPTPSSPNRAPPTTSGTSSESVQSTAAIAKDLKPSSGQNISDPIVSPPTSDPSPRSFPADKDTRNDEDAPLEWPSNDMNGDNDVGNFVFSAADGGSEAGISDTAMKQSNDRAFETNTAKDYPFHTTKYTGSGSKERNALKAKLESMNSAKPADSGTVVSSEDEIESRQSQTKEKGPKSFFKRMTECASPMIPTQCANPTQIDETGQEVPVSHLDFLKNTAKEISPATICGRPDGVVDDGKRQRSRSRSTGRHRSTTPTNASPRAASEASFGAKNAYLDAIALRTATEGSKKSSSTAGSALSHHTNESSEAWQSFITKRERSVGSRSNGAPDASKISTEEKAAQKVEEMMKAMAMNSKSKEDIDDMIESMSHVSSTQRTSDTDGRIAPSVPKKSESAKAAEELAAARVEEMMKAMSSENNQ